MIQFIYSAFFNYIFIIVVFVTMWLSVLWELIRCFFLFLFLTTLNIMVLRECVLMHVIRTVYKPIDENLKGVDWCLKRWFHSVSYSSVCLVPSQEHVHLFPRWHILIVLYFDDLTNYNFAVSHLSHTWSRICLPWLVNFVLLSLYHVYFACGVKKNALNSCVLYALVCLSLTCKFWFYTFVCLSLTCIFLFYHFVGLSSTCKFWLYAFVCLSSTYKFWFYAFVCLSSSCQFWLSAFVCLSSTNKFLNYPSKMPLQHVNFDFILLWIPLQHVNFGCMILSISPQHVNFDSILLSIPL